MACLSYLRDREDVKGLSVYIAGIGRVAPIALMVTAIDKDIAGLIGIGSLVSYLNYVQQLSPTYNMMALSYGVLREFDIPVVLASVLDRLVIWANPVDARGNVLNATEIAKAYSLPCSLVEKSEKIFYAGKSIDVLPLIMRTVTDPQSNKSQPDTTDDKILSLRSKRKKMLLWLRQ
jgi:hypothetical protein